MKITIHFLWLIFISILGVCQDTNSVKLNPEYYIIIDDSIVHNHIENNQFETKSDSLTIDGFDDTEFCIKFHGGDKALYKYIKKNIKLSKNLDIEGKILASFKVNEKGKIEAVTIEQGLREDIDKEIIRVLSEMTGWYWDCEEGPRRHVVIKIFVPIKVGLAKNK